MQKLYKLISLKILLIAFICFLNLTNSAAQIYTNTARSVNFSGGRFIEIGVEKDFTSPAFRKLRHSTKTIAVVPIQLSILPAKSSSSEFIRLKDQAYKEAYNARQMLYSFLLVEKNQKKSRIEMQNIVKTDSILYQSGITSENIAQYPPHQLARILGVENVIMVVINHNEKIAQPNLIVDNIITTTLALFKSGVINVSSYDGRQSVLTWSYQREITEGLGPDINVILLSVMQRTANFFPYFKS